MSEEERKFIHDIASPLTVACGMVEAALDENPGMKKLEKALAALNRIADLLRDRRDKLRAAPEPKT